MLFPRIEKLWDVLLFYYFNKTSRTKLQPELYEQYKYYNKSGKNSKLYKGTYRSAKYRLLLHGFRITKFASCREGLERNRLEVKRSEMGYEHYPVVTDYSSNYFYIVCRLYIPLRDDYMEKKYFHTDIYTFRNCVEYMVMEYLEINLFHPPKEYERISQTPFFHVLRQIMIEEQVCVHDLIEEHGFSKLQDKDKIVFLNFARPLSDIKK